MDDYIHYIDHIKQYLSRNEELLATYNQLTFGYQKDWARYVVSRFTYKIGRLGDFTLGLPIYLFVPIHFFLIQIPQNLQQL